MKSIKFFSAIYCLLFCILQMPIGKGIIAQTEGFNISIKLLGKEAALYRHTDRFRFVNGQIEIEKIEILPKDTDHSFISFNLYFKPMPGAGGFRLEEKDIVLSNAAKEVFTPVFSEDFTISGGGTHSISVTSLGGNQTPRPKSYFIKHNTESGLKLTFELRNSDEIADLSLSLNGIVMGSLGSLSK